MVRFRTDSIEESMRLGKEAADYVSETFIKPIKLEFEKVYCPYLLMNKKRYAGILYTKPDKHDKMDCKGLETVRRDNCQLTREVVKTTLNKLLIDKDEKAAIKYC
jgi:DNA polymerase delta subunit 1